MKTGKNLGEIPIIKKNTFLNLNEKLCVGKIRHIFNLNFFLNCSRPKIVGFDILTSRASETGSGNNLKGPYQSDGSNIGINFKNYQAKDQKIH